MMRKLPRPKNPKLGSRLRRVTDSSLVSVNGKSNVLTKKIEPLVLPDWCYFSKAACVQVHHKLYVCLENRHGTGEFIQIRDNGKW